MTTAQATQTNYTVIVRTWFDKKGGNTYYSMRVVEPNGDDFILPYAYGHGYATFIHSARIALGLPEGDDSARYVVDETKVARRKDLHNEGKS